MHSKIHGCKKMLQPSSHWLFTVFDMTFVISRSWESTSASRFPKSMSEMIYYLPLSGIYATNKIGREKLFKDNRVTLADVYASDSKALRLWKSLKERWTLTIGVLDHRFIKIPQSRPFLLTAWCAQMSTRTPLCNEERVRIRRINPWAALL